MLDDYCTLVTMIVETIKVPVEEVVELCKLILSSGVSSKLVAGDMLRLFSRLKKEGHLTFFNQDLLSAIVTKFGDEKCVQSWRQFEGRFQSYCRDRVVQDKVAQDLVYAQREEQTAKRFVARSAFVSTVSYQLFYLIMLLPLQIQANIGCGQGGFGG